MTHLRPARGTALRQHKAIVRFATGAKPGPKQDHKLHSRVAEVRKLLRTSMSIEEIANELEVGRSTLVGFIKRRNLCTISERNYFITLQRSLAREEAREADR